MMNFADRLQASIDKSKSVLCAGFDPNLESFPEFILTEARTQAKTTEDAVYIALTTFYEISVQVLAGRVAAIKPNIAFFEQYGLGGLRAFASVCRIIKNAGIPVIADIKRGDIGSTAQAYSSAFLGASNVFGDKQPIFDVDAVTVNPYLGFDTLKVFLEDCKNFGKGMFVLVKTSNPGSGDLQDLETLPDKLRVSEVVANWLAENSGELIGQCGLSGLGAVVGATYPDEAKNLRTLMPNNLFLIPGFGAQGSGAKDTLAGMCQSNGHTMPRGGVVNASRGLFGEMGELTLEQLRAKLIETALKFSGQLVLLD